MGKETVLKNRVVDHFSLVIDGEDGAPARTWKLCYDYRAIALVEERIGKDIKRIEDWKELSSGKHFPVIVHCGLRRFNPEVTLDEVLDVLNPEAQRILTEEIIELMFPGAREAYERAERQRAKAAEGHGEPEPPNGQTPATA